MLNFNDLTIIFKYKEISIKNIQIQLPNTLDLQACMNEKKSPDITVRASYFYSKLKLFQFYFSTSFF